MKKAGTFLSAALLMGGLSTATLALEAGHAGALVTRGTISKIDRDSGKIELMKVAKREWDFQRGNPIA